MDARLPLRRRFRERFGTEGTLYRAPGRINLIGEHTDYNGGFVMPAAIEKYCWVAGGPRADRKLVIHSEDFSETIEADLARSVAPQRRGTWRDYPLGVAVTLEHAGLGLRGANLLIHGEVPQGAGLSSSAAIEVATALALLEIAGHSLDRVQLARLCQQAENEFVGARCGIMDQFVACHGRAGHALKLDCRSLQYELLLIPDSVQLIACNTRVKHELASGEYNQRGAECEEAVKCLATVIPGVRSLRDVSLEQLERHRGRMTEKIYRRALHVVTENVRVMQAADALRAKDIVQFGKLMGESHASLRDRYEVSCAELDLMVDLAGKEQGVFGARMMGGGFGGCTINLVDARHAETLRKNVAAAYERQSGIRPEIYVCTPAEGAGRVADESA